jgi:ribosome-associated heat shock protein Hsp15
MPAADRQRIDKWLFFARVVKSRSLAAKLVAAGRVRLNRDKIEQASQPVKAGDVLTVALDRRVLVYRILAPGVRRGPAEEARTLYEDLSAAKEPSSALSEEREPGAGRPTKKDRRALDRLKDNSG